MRIPNLKGVLFWWTLYDVSLLISDAARNVPTALRMIGGHTMTCPYVLLLF